MQLDVYVVYFVTHLPDKPMGAVLTVCSFIYASTVAGHRQTSAGWCWRCQRSAGNFRQKKRPGIAGPSVTSKQQAGRCMQSTFNHAARHMATPRQSTDIDKEQKSERHAFRLMSVSRRPASGDGDEPRGWKKKR